VADLPRWALWIGGAWLLWSTLATLLATHVEVAVLRQTEWLLHGAAAASLWAFLCTYPHWRAHVPKAIVTGFILYGAIAGAFLLHIPDPDHFPWLKAMLGFRNIRHFSAYAAIALIAAMAPLLTRGTPDRRVLWRTLSQMVAPWAFLFWSGGRGAFIGVVAALAVMTILKLLPRPGRTWGLALATALVGLTISIPFTPPHGSYGVFRLANDLVDGESVNDYSSGRLELWHQAAGMVARHPAFGLGPDNYAHTPRGASEAFEHPHNAVLQSALEWGIPGLLFACAGLGMTVLTAGRALALRAEAPALAGFGIALILLTLSMVAGALYYGLSVMMCLFSVACALPHARHDCR
jgi:O-antigen ligase